MAYARLMTRNASGIHPNFRGLGAYAYNSTKESGGLSPNFRGLGDAPTTTFSIGPGGAFSLDMSNTPAATPTDQVTYWLSSSTIFAGIPNAVLAIGGGLFLLATFFGGKARR